jgi:hypothetical protein
MFTDAPGSMHSLLRTQPATPGSLQEEFSARRIDSIRRLKGWTFTEAARLTLPIRSRAPLSHHAFDAPYGNAMALR